MAENIIKVPLNHKKEPHCCGCVEFRWNIELEAIEGYCNECGAACPVPTVPVE